MPYYAIMQRHAARHAMPATDDDIELFDEMKDVLSLMSGRRQAFAASAARAAMPFMD